MGATPLIKIKIKIKKELSSSRIISYYDPNPSTPTILQCDASQIGLGAWLR